MPLPCSCTFALAASLLIAAGELRAVLPDTGQTARHTRTFGEDSDFAGAGPRLRDNGDGTVSDEVKCCSTWGKWGILVCEWGTGVLQK